MSDSGKSLESPNESDRVRQAYDMRLAGAEPHRIAEELDFASVNDLLQAIQYRFGKDVRDITSLERDSLLALELARLDALQEGLWLSATLGDPKSYQLVLNTIMIRIKLLKLDQPEAQQGQQTVLIVGGKEEEYVAQLKELADG